MGRLAAISVTAVVMLLLIARVAANEGTAQLPMLLRSGVPATVILDVNPGGPLNQTAEDNSVVYTNSTYEVHLSESLSEKYSIIQVRISRKDGEAFELPGFALSVRVSSKRLKGVWYPSAASLSNDVMAGDASVSLHSITTANEGIPYIAGAAADGQNVIAVGLARQDFAVEVEASPVDLDRLELRLHAHGRRTAQVFDESFYVSSETAVNWFDAAANYADWVDQVNGYRPMPVSSKAYEPLYDLWYFTQDRVNEGMYLSSAELASEMGFGSFLADSGWDAPVGEYSRWLEGRTGDYDAPPDKFRNLKGTFDQIRSSRGLSVQLWLQPFAVGRDSVRYSVTKDLHIRVPSNGFTIPGWGGFGGAPFYLPSDEDSLENVNLCPRLTATATYLYELIREVADKYKPDGYWFDFIDGMPSFCSAAHAHDIESFGEGVKLSLGAIRSAIQETTPDAVVQFRANYANLHNKEFANVWQPEDSPGNFDQMRLKALRMRPFSKGVAFASDQLYWDSNLDDTNVSRFIMTSVMVGVPAFGPDLNRMPQSAREITKAWMRFYRLYQKDLNYGRFSPFGPLPVPNHKIESEDRSFVYLRNLDSPLIDVQTTNIYLLNATDSDLLRVHVRVPAGSREYSIVTTNRFLRVAPGVMTVTATPEATLDLDIVVEKGGMAILIG